MDPVAPSSTRALVDIDSTTGREGDAGRWLARLPARARVRGHRAAVDDTRFNVLATHGEPRVVFSTHFDCVPPFFPSRVEGDRLLRPRRVRREGHSGRAGRGSRPAARAMAKRGSACCSSSAKSAAATARASANTAARGCRYPDQRRTDRQPAGRRDARHSASAAAGERPRGAFVVPRARRVGDRQAARRAGGAADDGAARRMRFLAARTTRSGSSRAASRRTWCRRRQKPK